MYFYTWSFPFASLYGMIKTIWGISCSVSSVILSNLFWKWVVFHIYYVLLHFFYYSKLFVKVTVRSFVDILEEASRFFFPVGFWFRFWSSRMLSSLRLFVWFLDSANFVGQPVMLAYCFYNKASKALGPIWTLISVCLYVCEATEKGWHFLL